MDEEESRVPYANGTSTGTVVRRRVAFMGVGRQLGEEEWRDGGGGRRGRERTSRVQERERTEKRRDERGSGKRRDKVTGTGMVMAISEDRNDANMWQTVYKGEGERAATEKK